MDRYQVKIADTCGMCDGAGTIIDTVGYKMSESGEATEAIEESKACDFCKGVGRVDERWVTMAKFLILAKENL